MRTSRDSSNKKQKQDNAAIDALKNNTATRAVVEQFSAEEAKNFLIDMSDDDIRRETTNEKLATRLIEYRNSLKYVMNKPSLLAKLGISERFFEELIKIEFSEIDNFAQIDAKPLLGSIIAYFEGKHGEAHRVSGEDLKRMYDAIIELSNRNFLKLSAQDISKRMIEMFVKERPPFQTAAFANPYSVFTMQIVSRNNPIERYDEYVQKAELVARKEALMLDTGEIDKPQDEFLLSSGGKVFSYKEAYQKRIANLNSAQELDTLLFDSFMQDTPEEGKYRVSRAKDLFKLNDYFVTENVGEDYISLSIQRDVAISRPNEIARKIRQERAENEKEKQRLTDENDKLKAENERLKAAYENKKTNILVRFIEIFKKGKNQ